MWGTGQSFSGISSFGVIRLACPVAGHFGVSGGFSSFSPEAVLEPCRLVTLWKASWGWTPRKGMGKCLTHHTTWLSLWAKIRVCNKCQLWHRLLPPSYSYAILHLLNRRSELSRVSPLAASWFFLLLFWLFSGLKHQVWFTRSSSCQTPMYRAVRVCFCWGNRTVWFSSLQHSAHTVFSQKTRECCPLHL